MTLSAGTRLGSYEILAPLGAGGMGEVYRARDARLGRDVALKVLPEEVSGDHDRLARFEQEARAASALNHPNIVTIYEVGASEGTAFIAMELVDGKTLRELSASDPLSIRRVIGIAVQVADGLAKAHGVGIVHRDLKPENVMVSKDGYVKILDFGLAKLVEPESGEVSGMPTLARPETHPGTVLGTVGYMSPEQASGLPLDFRSDQFSFGSILYEILAGQKAFARKTAAETMSAIIRDDPEPIAARRPDSPPPLRWIVERCLAKDPEERYASTRDLARDLAAARDRISEITSGGEAVSRAPARGALSARVPALVAAVAILAAGAAGWLAARGARCPATAPSFHRISFRSEALANARFAPDGQTVIYGAMSAAGSQGGRFTLQQTRLESPESRQFDFPDADILSISATGEMAVLLHKERGDVLARVPLAGGVPREVFEGVSYAGADWGPDGNSFAIVRQDEARYRLEYPIGKVLFESVRPILSPRFSPNGREIAFFQVEEATTSVASIAAGGGERKILTGGWGQPNGVPGWSPDGREVWFTAAHPGEHAALNAVNRSGKVRLIARVPGELELDDIAKDGKILVGHHTQVMTTMGAGPGETAERDLSWLDQSVPADISADGRKLLVSEQGEAGGPNLSVYLRPTNGSPPVRLGDGAPATISWDGAWVVAKTGFAQGRKPHLVVYPTGAGEPRLIANDVFADFGWVNWLPDGKRLVFMGAEPGHGSRLYVQEIAGGKPRPISPEGLRLRPFGNSVAPDGKLVLALKGNVPVLLSTDGGEPRPVSGWARGDLPVQWSSDSRALYGYRRAESPAKLFLFDLATGRKRPWKEIRPADPLAGGLFRLVVSPDGSAYAYECNHFMSELYVIEGLR